MVSNELQQRVILRLNCCNSSAGNDLSYEVITADWS